MNCKDCIRCDACEMYDGFDISEPCVHFSDKSEWLQFPFSIGTKLYRITTPYRGHPEITEFVVTNFVMQGKKHELMAEVRVNGVPGICLRKTEAALSEMPRREQ